MTKTTGFRVAEKYWFQSWLKILVHLRFPDSCLDALTYTDIHLHVVTIVKSTKRQVADMLYKETGQ